MSAIAFEHVGKVFPGVVALDDVSFRVAGGEIRALMGENGAGKSTLLKILAGEYRPDGGAVQVDGVARSFSAPRDSAAAGIAIIHQELQLAPNLSVAENLLLGAMPTRSGWLDRSAMRATAARILDRLGERIDPSARVGDLPIGKRQMIEIGKALLRDARIIAFDEPTSSLSAREIETLLRIIRDLRDEGRAILYVSHRMEEVFALADSVTVLRDGRHVQDWRAIGDVDQPRLIRAMAGRTIDDIYRYRPRQTRETMLTAEAIEGPGLRGPVSLSARRGEIVGLFGLVGAGRTELLKLIFGAVPRTGGRVMVGGAVVAAGSPRAAIAMGIALCPEDRKDEGIVPLAAVRENIALARRNMAGGGRIVNRAGEEREARTLIDLMQIRTASAETAIGTLSGGNQQKAVIARWLAAGADIMLLDEPTRGIDVAARSEIYEQMYRLAEEGKTIVFASSDMPEVLGVADRIIVMEGGRVTDDIARADADSDRLLRAALPGAAMLELTA